MKVNVLDHGYVEFIEAWGTGKAGIETVMDTGIGPMVKMADYEVGIIEAARQSTSGSFRGWEEDAKLLQYLYTHKHNTPFEFGGMILEIQAPIMVFREWQRHRTFWYNEMSARYIPLPPLYYHCPVDEIIERAKAVTNNKQANGISEVDEAAIRHWENHDEWLSKILEDHYQRGLSIGIPKELARKKMPVDHYSRMRAGASLRNWLAFMTLRCDMKAQKEIRMFANVVAEMINSYFPQTYQLWAKEFLPDKTI